MTIFGSWPIRPLFVDTDNSLDRWWRHFTADRYVCITLCLELKTKQFLSTLTQIYFATIIYLRLLATLLSK